MNTYNVNVGNIGSVYSGRNCRAAKRAFREYVSQSKTGYGRASGENVTLTCNDEPIKEYFSPAQAMREDMESGECAIIHASGEITLCGKYVATIGAWEDGEDTMTQAQGLRALREAMTEAQFWPNCYVINDHGNVSCVSTRTGKAYKGMSWV